MANPPSEAVSSLSFRIVNSLRTFSHGVSIVVVGIGLVVLLGWGLDIDILTRIIPGRVTQKPNTALGLVVAGTALMLWHRQLNLPPGRLKRSLRLSLFSLSGLVVVLGLWTTIEYGFGLGFELDPLLVGTPRGGIDGLVGGRPAPNTAVSFGLIGLALLLLTNRHYRVAQGFSIAAFSIALLAITGHLYAVTGFYSVGSVTGMAVHTAIAFLLLSLGILCAQADQGWIRELSTDHIGSVMVRQLLPVLVVLPILLGASVLLVYRQLSLRTEEAIALRSILSVVMFIAVVLLNGRSLNRLDAQRLWLQQRFNHELESQVAIRTAELHAANRSLEREVNRRQQIAAELRQSQSSLRQQLAEIEIIYQSAPIGLNVIDSDLRFVRINERLAEMNGFSIEDHIGRTVGELLPDLADAAEQLLLPIFKTGDPVLNIEIKGETPAKPGVQRIWLESFLPLKDGDRVVGISTVCEEVTERRQTEADLVNRAIQQAAVAQIGQQALASTDIDALLETVTARAAQVLEVEFCKVLERLPEERGFLLRSGVGWQDGLVGQAIVPSGSESQAGYTLLSRDPIVVEDLTAEPRFTGPDLLTQHGVVSGMSTLIGNYDANPYGIFGIHTRSRRHFTDNDVDFLQAIANILAEAIARHESVRDLRQLNSTLEQRVRDRTQDLQEANQELEAFSYSVAHDLRAPLRAIQGFGQVLQEDYHEALDDLARDYVRRMAVSAENLDSLVQDLLAYSRLRRSDIELKRISPNTVLTRVLSALEPTLSARHAQIDIAPDMPRVYAQHNVLKQILSNLVDNALKFALPETLPQVKIWAEVRHGSNTAISRQRVRIWIEDNGIGIIPRHQERIFRPFERLHGVEAYQGTGIGLSIVKRGVERMGGEAGVESTIDKGSRFWIELNGDMRAPHSSIEQLSNTV